MNKISIYGLKSNRKRVLELLQRKGAVEITDSELEKNGIFQKTDTQPAK